MTQHLLKVLEGMGIIGLLIVMAIEGLSIPFPSIFIVPTYGYFLNPSLPEMMGIAMGMSLIYCIFSYIPYRIGFKLNAIIEKRLQRKVQKAQRWFQTYGERSIPLTRLLGMGYISYVAGVSKVKPWKFGLLTFTGIYPWSFVMLFLGRTYKGNAKVVTQLFQVYGRYFFFGLLIISLGYGGVLLLRRKVDPVKKNLK